MDGMLKEVKLGILMEVKMVKGAKGVKGDPFRKLTQALLRILSESRISPTRCSKMCGTTVLLARRTTLSYTPILAKDTNDFL